MCASKYLFSRLDCVFGARSGKVASVCVLGDVFEFRTSEFTIKRLSDFDAGVLEPKMRIQFCYRTAGKCTKTWNVHISRVL